VERGAEADVAPLGDREAGGVDEVGRVLDGDGDRDGRE